METIEYSQLDKNFKYEIAARPGAAFFKRCFSCGTCTASCPVSGIDAEFNPRLIIRKALLGMRKEVLASKMLWHCAQCYTCYARCPQDVRFTDIMTVLREMACAEGYFKGEIRDKIKQVDQLVQELRHGITEYTLQSLEGGRPDAMAKKVRDSLDQGLGELSK